MAKKVVVELIDDLDGTPIKKGEGETVVFAVNDTEYSIDLNAKNADSFHETLRRYIDRAEKLGSRRSGPARAARGPKREAAQTKAIREWAIAEGHQISDRGRIPAEIEKAYNNAH